jgi:hypothetical protein
MNEYAFPVPNLKQNGYPVTGMTLRDYFAAMAMSGMLPDQSKYFDTIVEMSYVIADKMLEARK